MAIETRETFRVQAPVERVWPFVTDPHKIVTCMPGAALEEVVDDRTYRGSVKVKIGAITATYRGRVQFAALDHERRTVEVVADGRETGGGTARGTMRSHLRALPDGETEVVVEATIDLTGRVMQVGRGMIQGVSHQLFQQFAASVKQRLETPGEECDEAGTREVEPVRLLPVLLATLLSAIARFFRRLLGRPPAET